MGNTILQTNELGITFDGLVALSDVEFHADQGDITAIIGPNGAGKTTFFNLIAGFYTPTKGTVSYAGKDITKLKPYERAEAGIARTFQNINLFRDMSVLDNALVGLHCRSKSNVLDSMLRTPRQRKEEKALRTEVMETLEFLGLADVALEKAGSLSYGMQKNLEIARALASRPKIVLLDEPASGLNTQDLKELSKRILGIRDRGIAVVLIEHKMDVVMSISDKIMVLNFGREIAFGTPDEIKNNHEVIEAYLGKEDE
ncbi:MAG: ABC transporter ATP-binding protein [Acetanaerobacterium sp.]